MSDRGPELINKLIDQENLRFEGEAGLKALCRLAAVLGYKDRQYFGQIDHNAVIGDFIEFLQDNPGVVEAIFDWVGQQGNTDFLENLASAVDEEYDEDYEDNEDSED